MAGGSKKGRIRSHKPTVIPDVRSEMNVTPLVDVCLVLLIIFMVVTPMLARGKDVPLPKTKNHASERDGAQPIVVIDKDAQIYFDKDPLGTLEKMENENFISLKERIEAEFRSDLDMPQRVLIKADKDLPYKDVYPIIIAIHELDLTEIDLGSNELKDD